MLKLYPIMATILFLSGCGFGKKWSDRIKETNQFEKVALNLAKKNRLLKLKINDLENENNQLKLKNKYASISGKIGAHRKISSLDENRDLVRFKDYRWTAEELLFVAEIEFERRDFEKASQFLHALITYYPKFPRLNDKVIYYAAFSSYESGKHYDWAQKFFEKLISEYPESPYYLSSKLWWALTLYKIGKKKKFRSKLEEFKELYKNTPEWKVLSKHYEKIK